MALVLLTAIVAFRGLPEQGFAGWFPWAMLAGVSGAMGLLCFYAALSTGTMGVVAPIAAVGSGIPVLLGVLSGEKPSALAWWGIAVAIAGVVLASGPEMKEGLGARPVLLACLAAVGFGVALFALDRGARVSLLHTLWGMRITSAIGYAALALAARSSVGSPAATCRCWRPSAQVILPPTRSSGWPRRWAWSASPPSSDRSTP